MILLILSPTQENIPKNNLVTECLPFIKNPSMKIQSIESTYLKVPP